MGGTRNKEDSDELKGLVATIHNLDEKNAELLAACKRVVKYLDPDGSNQLGGIVDQLYTAIAFAEK